MGAAAGGMALVLIIVAIFFIVYIAIGAAILLAACWLYNKLASNSEAQVPYPSFVAAMGIVIGASIVNGLATFVLTTGMEAALGPGGQTEVAASFLGLPIQLLLVAAFVSVVVPTTFLRALAIAGLNLLILIVTISPFIALAIYSQNRKAQSRHSQRRESGRIAPPWMPLWAPSP
jgi:hypothetical protein